MNDFEIEQILTRCKLKDVPADTRNRVLATAHAAWNAAPPSKSLWAWSIWRWPTYYAAAAALLLLLNGIVTGLDERRINAIIAEKTPALDETPTAIEQLYVELGLDPKMVRPLLILAARHEPKGYINEFLRRKNQLLQATELL